MTDEKPSEVHACADLAAKRVKHGVAFQKCLNASTGRTMKATSIGGLVGGVAAFFLTRHPTTRLAFALAAAAAGALASRYHVTADWDPDLACGKE